MLTREQKATALGAGVFSGLPEGVRAALAERMGERHLEPGETLFMEGEPGSEIYVIVSGELEIRRGCNALARLGAGEVVGEMAVLGRGLRTADGVSRGKTHLLFLKDKAIKLLIQQIPDLALALFQVLIDRLNDANELALFLAGEPVEKARVVVEGGDLAGQHFSIYREREVLGRSLGSLVGDGLRLALPSREPGLRERHAEVSLVEGTVYLEPLEGESLIGGVPLNERMAVGPEDVVSIGALELRFHVRKEG